MSARSTRSATAALAAVAAVAMTVTVTVTAASDWQSAAKNDAWGTVVREEMPWQQGEEDDRTRTALAALPIEDFAPSVFEASSGRRMPYRLLRPAGEKPGRRYPLVVMLHSSGAIGDDNLTPLNAFVRSWAQPDTRQAFPAFVLVPQFATRSANYQTAEDGTTASQPGEMLVDALELIDATVSRQPVDAARVYAVGFSMGGSTAWHALLGRPRTFAAAVVLSGVPPSPETVNDIRVPVVVIHGTADTENPYAPTERFMERLLVANPLARLRVYRGLDHRVPVDILAGSAWRTWLFEQVRATD